MRKSLRRIRRKTFSALKVPNYRLYFAGQSVSLIGTWMQITAQAWLVLSLTHSSTDLGFVVALQTIPVLVLAPYGGVIADRVDKRRLMVVLQTFMGLQALTLGLLTLSGVVCFWEICALAVVLGLNNTFEMPSRQAFIREMVGRDELRNAVTLNSVMNNAARAVGPAVAGILIATVGDGACFVINAASFGAVVTSLVIMDRAALRPSVPEPRARGQLRQGLAYAARTTEIAVPLVMMTLVGMLAYEFSVSLPFFATRTFHGGSEVYGFMTAAMGIGAVVGGLFTAARGRTGLRPMILACLGFGLAILLTALSPDLVLAYVGLSFVGWASVSFVSVGNSTIQLSTERSMRGRMLALWQLAFQGTTPIGGPLIGWVIAESEPRIGLLVGAATCLLAAGLGAAIARHRLSSSRSSRAIALATTEALTRIA
ncbi:MAG: MFS transporter [Acidimicrobiales bacterium]